MDRNTRKLTRASSSSPSASLQRLLSMQTQMKGITRCHDSITGLFVWKKNIILYHAIFLFRLPWLFIQHLQHHFAQQQLFLLSCLHKTFQEHFRCKINNFPCVPFYVSTFSLRTKHKKNRRQSSNEQLNLLSFRHQDKGPHFFVDWKSVVFTTVADSSKSWQSITSPSLSSCLLASGHSWLPSSILLLDKLDSWQDKRGGGKGNCSKNTRRSWKTCQAIDWRHKIKRQARSSQYDPGVVASPRTRGSPLYTTTTQRKTSHSHRTSNNVTTKAKMTRSRINDRKEKTSDRILEAELICFG